MKPRGASGQQEALSPLLASCSSPIHREISLNQIRRSRIDGRGGGYALAARTGQVVWSVRTPGTAKYEASPLAADGKIYLFNFDGQVAVLSATSGEVLHVIPMDKPVDGEMVRASIIAAHGQLFIRTTRKLYCVGKGR